MISHPPVNRLRLIKIVSVSGYWNVHTYINSDPISLFPGAFRLYDVDNDGFITRDEMYNIVDAIYQMVVSVHGFSFYLVMY